MGHNTKICNMGRDRIYCPQLGGFSSKDWAYPEVLLLQVSHHGVDSRSEHVAVGLVVAVGQVNGALSFAAHPLHVLLVLLLDVLHSNVVYAVKQRHLQPPAALKYFLQGIALPVKPHQLVRCW